jgi:hypothetical protein
MLHHNGAWQLLRHDYGNIKSQSFLILGGLI